MRVYLGSDHAGFELKAHLLTELAKQGYDAVDVGAHTYDAQDDYPSFCLATGAAVVAEPGSLGVVIGGSGNGEQIAANKIKGVRAALAWNLDTATLARQHAAAERGRHRCPPALDRRGDRAGGRVPGDAVLRRAAASATHRRGGGV